MSGAGSQVAPIGPDGSSGRSPLAHLLHALNQPLTGLQCCMELALAGPRPTDHYLRTLSEGLELVSRMRLLVEALREIADLQAPATTERAAILLDSLLREAVRELQPVAESKDMRLLVETSVPLPVRADIGRLTALLFRVIDCAITLSARGSVLRIEATCDRSTASITFSWVQGPPLENSPFSRPELGLLVAQAAWEHLGGSCTQFERDMQHWVLRIPLAWPAFPAKAEPRFVGGGGSR